MHQKDHLYNNILVVGGTYRNLGKTEFICRLLQKFLSERIVVIKIKTIYEGDAKYHGRGYGLASGYIIRKENGEKGLDDSKRFLAAGASSVFYIRARAEKLEEAVKNCLKQIPKEHLIICESNSIVDVLSPAVFIMIKGGDKERFKPSSIRLMAKANIIIESAEQSFETDPEDLDLFTDGKTWAVKG